MIPNQWEVRTINKTITTLFLFIAMVLFLGACSSETDEPQKEDGKIVVDFWHSMGGNNLSVLEDIIDDYNDTQNDAIINPIYQGSYREGFSKINSVIGTDEIPALMQLNEESTKPMIDMDEIKPMQDFIDKDDFNIDDFEPAILGRYEVDNKLYSMPFNPSIAVVYYNKDAFEEAGLNPNDPPQTYSEYEDAAKKLTKKDGEKIERYGINIRNFGWHYEQLRVNQGGTTVNNENGRDGEPTEATVNNEETLRSINWIKDMYDEDLLLNLGRNGDDVKDAFFAEKVGMMVDSSSVAVPTMDTATFDVGIAKYPIPDDIEPKGSVIGGASLWIFDQIPEETQDATWDFIQHLMKPEVQAEWTTKTGYFPITTDVYETDEYMEYLEEYPDVQTSYDQLELSSDSPVNQGAYIGVYPDIRVIMEDVVEKILDDSIEVEDGLNQANDEITKELEKYQKTQGN